MFKRLGLIVLVGSALLVPPYLSAHAQGQGQRFEEAFKNADKDSDGSLSRDEAEALPGLAKDFDTIDADKSGTVTRDEIRASAVERAKAKGEASFKAADKDGNGALSREEAEALPKIAQNFDVIDADGSGTITEQEIKDSMKKRRARRQQ